MTAVLLALVHVPQLQLQRRRRCPLDPSSTGSPSSPARSAKLALTIYAAHWLSSKDDEIKHSAKGLVPFGAVLGFTTLLIFRQPDLGTGAMISGRCSGCSSSPGPGCAT